MTGSPYPEGFHQWPLEKRNAHFAQAARDYDARKAAPAPEPAYVPAYTKGLKVLDGEQLLGAEFPPRSLILVALVARQGPGDDLRDARRRQDVDRARVRFKVMRCKEANRRLGEGYAYYGRGFQRRSAVGLLERASWPAKQNCVNSERGGEQRWRPRGGRYGGRAVGRGDAAIGARSAAGVGGEARGSDGTGNSSATRDASAG